MSMLLKYILRAGKPAASAIETFRYPNSQKRDLSDSNEGED